MSKPDTKQLFISVGSRFAMNRLLECVEAVLQKHPELIAKAQIGHSSFQSPLMQTYQWASATEFDHAVSDCDIFISHAGMGNILLAAKYNTPIIIMPRRMDQGEHINDHQLSTVEALKGRPFMHSASDSTELEQAIIDILDSSADSSNSSPVLINQGQDNQSSKAILISALRNFIDNESD